jgi:uncharacterized MAPEG superfamily protein
MEIHLLCIVAAWLVIYLTKLPIAIAMQRAGGYDNRLPRAQQARLDGWGARAVAAHKNGFESFAPFAAAVLVAHLGGGPARLIDLLAIAFVVARVGYVICYLADWATLRSAVWSVGFLLTFALFLTPFFA